jgi:hypothetical protein
VLHFIPASSSWLNLIERWFAELSQKAVRRGVFHSVRDLQRAIAEFLTAWNAAPAPFVLTASSESILDKITRARQRLEQIEPGSTQPKRRSSIAITPRTPTRNQVPPVVRPLCRLNCGTLH